MHQGVAPVVFGLRILQSAGLLLAGMWLGLGPNLPAYAIFGGRDATRSDDVANYVVAVHLLKPNGNWSTCSGTLLDRQTVITAAHCAWVDKKSMRVIFAPAIDNAPKKMTRRVTAIVVHDGYDLNLVIASDPNDVALLRLDKPAPTSAKVMALISTDEEFSFPRNAMIAGYGGKSFSKSAKQASGNDRILRVADVTVKYTNGVSFTIDQTHGSGACTGDSGGPLFVESEGGFSLLGVAVDVASPKSDDNECDSEGHELDVRKLSAWIAANLTSLSSN